MIENVRCKGSEIKRVYPPIPISDFIIQFNLERMLEFIKYIFKWNSILNSEKVVLLASLSYEHWGTWCERVGWSAWIPYCWKHNSKELRFINASSICFLIQIIYVFSLSPFLRSFFIFIFLAKTSSRFGIGRRISRLRSTNFVSLYVTFPLGLSHCNHTDTSCGPL